MFLRKKQTATVALEISDDFVKVCLAKSTKAGISVALASRALASRDSANITEELKAVFSELKIDARSVLVNIPRHYVMVRFLSIPATKDDEIANIVRMESVRQSPYGPDESIAGFKVIEKKKDGYSDILIAIVQKDFIENLAATIGSLGVNSAKMAFGTETLANWFGTAAKGIRSADDRNIAIVNVDAKHINIDLCENDKIIYSRAFAHKSEGTVSGKTAADEIIKTVTAYQKEKGLVLNRIFITGAEERLVEIEPALRPDINVPVELIRQDKGIVPANDPSATGPVSFVELIGLALKPGDAHVNLLPVKILKENELAYVKYNLTKTVLLLASVTLIIFAIVLKGLIYRTQTITKLTYENKKLQPKAAELKKMKDAIAIINQEVQKKPMAIEVLAEICKVTPADMRYSSMDYETGKAVALKGSAGSMDSILRLVNMLEASQYFENVKIKYTSKKENSASKDTDFEVVGVMSKV